MSLYKMESNKHQVFFIALIKQKLRQNSKESGENVAHSGLRQKRQLQQSWSLILCLLIWFMFYIDKNVRYFWSEHRFLFIYDLYL